ncbi:MAG TPA: YeeE/YedE family protein, partial [Advenella sp.]|nr:YeeE/YedE family protein [Advenella sp.]
MASNPSTLASPARSQINLVPAAVSAALIMLGLIYLNGTVSGRQAALWIVGILLGATLYHSAFGFTSSWRVFISDRRGAGLRAQMLMLAFGCLLFFPVLGNGTLW